MSQYSALVQMRSIIPKVIDKITMDNWFMDSESLESLMDILRQRFPHHGRKVEQLDRSVNGARPAPASASKGTAPRPAAKKSAKKTATKGAAPKAAAKKPVKKTAKATAKQTSAKKTTKKTATKGTP